MISAMPTKNLTGITIQGDHDDFYELMESMHRLYGADDFQETDLFFGVKNRLLGICYEIRHASMGNRDVFLQENGMSKELMKWHNIKTPTQNVYFSVNLLFPEAIFMAVSAPKVYFFSASSYGENGKFLAKNQYFASFPYSDYLRDKANIDIFCAAVWQALGSVIGDEELEKIINLAQRTKENYVNYATHYIDKCNIELIKADPEKRKSKLKNIAKRIIKKPTGYNNLEEDLKYWAKEYNTSIYELELPDIEYPDDIEW